MQKIDKPNFGTYVFCFINCSDLLWENCSTDREKLLKLEAEGREFSKTMQDH